MPVNENEAPEGYVAAPAMAGCAGCDIEHWDDCKEARVPCYGAKRKDGANVIFIKKEPKMHDETTNAMNTVYPHKDIVIAYMEGKIIQQNEDGNWEDLPVFSGRYVIPSFPADAVFRIKPEEKRGQYRIALLVPKYDLRAYTLVADSEAEQEHISKHPDFVKWLTDWVEYTIPEQA